MTRTSPLTAMHQTIPPASLIICSRNRRELLRDTVHSVLGGEQLPSEIVIIDQSDMPDPVLEPHPAVRGCSIRYHWTDCRGVSASRNAGASTARHDLLVFIDDDMIAAAGWFGTLLIALLDAGDRTVVTGQVAPAVEAGFVPSTKTDPIPVVYSGRTGSDVLFSGNMALHRATLMQIGGFDGRLGPGTPFPAAEDNDVGFRLLESGYRIAYVPQAVLYHRAWRTRTAHLALRWRYGLGQGAFYAKHLDLADRYMLHRLTGELKTAMRSVGKTMFTQPSSVLGELLYMFALLAGAAGWLWSFGYGSPPLPETPCTSRVSDR